MRSASGALGFSGEAPDFKWEIRQIFVDLGMPPGTEVLASECEPAVDVYETDHTIELVVDLPEVTPDAVRVLVKGGSVLIAGHKASRRTHGPASFHLVERGYGRFIRVVPLVIAVDAHRAGAALTGGILRVSLPKVDDRRGEAIRVPVTGDRAVA